MLPLIGRGRLADISLIIGEGALVVAARIALVARLRLDLESLLRLFR
jgi:hypothetical protein